MIEPRRQWPYPGIRAEKAKNNIPDIIISDIMMPVGGRLWVCRHVKEHFTTSHIRDYCSRLSLDEQKRGGFESGADPTYQAVHAELLRIRVNKLIEKNRPQDKRGIRQTPSPTAPVMNLAEKSRSSQRFKERVQKKASRPDSTLTK